MEGSQEPQCLDLPFNCFSEGWILSLFGPRVPVKQWAGIWKCWDSRCWAHVFEESLVSMMVGNWFSTTQTTTMETEFSVFHLFPRNVNYITSWLSMVGPAVGLNLPLSYARAAFQDEGNVYRQGKKRSLRCMFHCCKDPGVSFALGYVVPAGTTMY